MKKLLLSMMLLLMVVVAADAQSRSIGGRLGHGIEFSYQHSVGASNMVNLQVGLPFFNGFGLEGVVTYDWIFPITSWQEQGTWNWYAGVGGGVGMWDFNHPVGFAGVAGRIGVEYNFWFPMQLSLDWSPVIGPSFGHDKVGFNAYGMSSFGLGIRYLF